MDRALYLADRSKKLKEQLARPVDDARVLAGVRVWIDGYLEGTTDIAMKDVVKRAGGEILWACPLSLSHRSAYQPWADRPCRAPPTSSRRSS
jgi:hypothetical protein